jgi:hypothetical protein
VVEHLQYIETCPIKPYTILTEEGLLCLELATIGGYVQDTFNR